MSVPAGQMQDPMLGGMPPMPPEMMASLAGDPSMGGGMPPAPMGAPMGGAFPSMDPMVIMQALGPMFMQDQAALQQGQMSAAMEAFQMLMTQPNPAGANAVSAPGPVVPPPVTGEEEMTPDMMA